MKMTLRKFSNWIDVLGTIGIGVMVLFILFLIYASLRTWSIETQTDDNYEEVQKYVSNFQSWALANDITYSDIKESVCSNLNVKNRLSSDKYVDKETCLNRTKVFLNCNPETKKVRLLWGKETFVTSIYNPLTYENTLSLALSVKNSEDIDKTVAQCQSLTNKTETAPANLPVEQVQVEQSPSTLSQ